VLRVRGEILVVVVVVRNGVILEEVAVHDWKKRGL
jgi:hypothetical protein